MIKQKLAGIQQCPENVPQGLVRVVTRPAIGHILREAHSSSVVRRSRHRGQIHRLEPSRASKPGNCGMAATSRYLSEVASATNCPFMIAIA